MKKRETEPKLSLTMPVAYLDTYATQSTMHVISSRVAKESDKYATFFNGRTEYKILDCSLFDSMENLDCELLILLAERCQVNAIVILPFPFKDYTQTLDSTIEIATKIKEAGFSTVYVPHSEVGDVENWVEAYEWAANCDKVDVIGMSSTAIPSTMPYLPRSYARVVLAHLLIDRGIFATDKHHHYFEINAGPNLEIPPLINMNAIDSFDTAMPIWSAICGNMFSEMFESYAIRKVDKTFDFMYPLMSSVYIHRAIQTNINMTKQVLTI